MEGRVSVATQLLGDMARRDAGIVQKEPLGIEEIKAKIKQLNPEAREKDTLPPVPAEGDPMGLVLTPDSMVLAIRKLPKDTCSGSSGWTNRAIMAVALVTEYQQVVSETFTTVVNMCLDGSLAQGAVRIWSTGRAALIPKTDGSWRPLGMGECWYRLMGRAVVRAVAQGVGDELGPLQVAVGDKGGCEIAARMTQLLYEWTDEEEHEVAIMQLDMSNAFNMLPRGPMAEGVQRYGPELLRWTRLFYGHTSQLRLASGEIVGENATGVRQGDPMAMLLYAVGFHKVLLDLQVLVETEARECGSVVPAGVYGYADDTTCYMGPEVVERVVGQIEDMIQEFGMAINMKKGAILVKNPGGVVIPDGVAIPLELEGVKALGNPVGKAEYRLHYCDKKLGEMCEPLKAIHYIHPQSAMVILKESICAKPSYLARVMDYGAWEEQLRWFDTKVDEALGAILRVEDRGERMDTLRSMPTSVGGLGINRYAGHHGKEANRKSMELAQVFIRTHYTALADLVDKWEVELPNVGANLEQEVREAGVPHSKLPGAVQLAETYAVQWAKVYRQLLQEGKLAQAATLVSASQRGTGRWLTSHGGWDARIKVRAEEYRAALGLRLLLDPIPVPGNSHCNCHSTGTATYFRDSPLHPLCCFHHQQIRTRRHHLVRDLLYDLIKRLSQNAVCRRRKRWDQVRYAMCGTGWRTGCMSLMWR